MFILLAFLLLTAIVVVYTKALDKWVSAGHMRYWGRAALATQPPQWFPEPGSHTRYHLAGMLLLTMTPAYIMIERDSGMVVVPLITTALEIAFLHAAYVRKSGPPPLLFAAGAVLWQLWVVIVCGLSNYWPFVIFGIPNMLRFAVYGLAFREINKLA